MENNINIQPGKGTLKATALLYFKEALFKERYEECASLIQQAKEFGTQQSEISAVIADYVKGSAINERKARSQNSVRRF